MADYKGQPFVSIRDLKFSQENGYSYSYRERGTPQEMEGRAQAWANAGYDVVLSGTGPYRDLQASRLIGGGFYGFITRWSVRTETVEKPIWGLTAVKAEADAFTYTDADGKTLKGPAQYKKGIEDALGAGKSLPAAYNGLTEAPYVLQELSRGAEAYEHDYTVIERTVTFDPKKVFDTINFSESRLIYTTSQLFANENVPEGLLFSLPPSDGASDVQAMWGWRVRDQEADIDLGVSRTHRKSWVYANWSTFLYTPA